jgi:hypothetical protein
MAGGSLALSVIGKEPGRHDFFQVGEASVLLALLAAATRKGDELPPHGPKGPGSLRPRYRSGEPLQGKVWRWSKLTAHGKETH